METANLLADFHGPLSTGAAPDNFDHMIHQMPPSSTGMGSRLSTPRLMLTRAMNFR